MAVAQETMEKLRSAGLQEVDPEGNVLWEARPAQGGAQASIFAQFYVVQDLYTGATGG